MTLEEALKLAKENSEQWASFCHWEGKLVCENPKLQSLIMIPCLSCEQNLGLNGRCHNEKCELFSLE